MSDRIEIAIVGCGISGLGAAWAASRDPRVHVTLYESRSKLGGHANTVMVSVCPARAPRGRAAQGAPPGGAPPRHPRV
jgi:predicted NAD/FAD-binding protein